MRTMGMSSTDKRMAAQKVRNYAKIFLVGAALCFAAGLAALAMDSAAGSLAAGCLAGFCLGMVISANSDAQKLEADSTSA